MPALSNTLFRISQSADPFFQVLRSTTQGSPGVAELDVGVEPVTDGVAGVDTEDSGVDTEDVDVIFEAVDPSEEGDGSLARSTKVIEAKMVISTSDMQAMMTGKFDCQNGCGALGGRGR